MQGNFARRMRRWCVAGVAALAAPLMAQAAAVDLVITKDVSAPQVQTFTPFTYTLTVRNTGNTDGAATNAKLTDTLPLSLYGFTDVTVTPIGSGTVCPAPADISLPDMTGYKTTSAGNQTLSATIPNLPINGQCVISFKVAAAQTGSYVNIAKVDVDPQYDTDKDTQSNKATVTTTITAAQPDLALTKKQISPDPANGPVALGTPITYQVVFENKGTVSIPPQVWMLVTDQQQVFLSGAIMNGATTAISNVTCVGTGTTCPSDWAPGTSPQPAGSATPFSSGAIRGMPAGAKLTYTYTLTTTATGRVCAQTDTAISLYNAVNMLVYPPNPDGTAVAFTDPDGLGGPTTAVAYVKSPGACVFAPLEVISKKELIDADKTLSTNGTKTFRFTVTRNPTSGAGSAQADASPLTVELDDQMLYWMGYLGGPVTHTAVATKCATSGTASCPSEWANKYPFPLVDGLIQGINGTTPTAITTAYPFSQSKPTVTLGVNGSVTFEVELGYAGLDKVTCVTKEGDFHNGFGIKSFGTPPSGFDAWQGNAPGSSVDIPIKPDKPLCIDVAVTKSIDKKDAEAGQPITFTLEVTNGTSGIVGVPRTAKNVVLSDPLGSQFIPSSVSCSLKSGVADVPSVSLANITGADNTFSAVIPSMDDGAVVACQITGAVVTAGTFNNQATVNGTTGTVGGTLADMNDKNNKSDQNYGIGKPASIVLTQTVTGATAGYVSGTTFPVTVSCKVTQLPAGTETEVNQTINLLGNSSQTVNIPATTSTQTVSCTVTEGTQLPATVSGYQWGTATVNPITVSGLGPAQSGSVAITNPLERMTTGIAVNVNVTGGPASGVTGAFLFTANCGADGTYSTTVSLTGMTSGSGSITGMPVGATCTVTETSPLPTAPGGYTWGATPPPVTVTTQAGSPQHADFTNPLKTDAVPVQPVPVGPVWMFSLLLALLGSLGVGVRRRA